MSNTLKKNQIKIGSRWSSNDFTRFVVTSIKVIDEKTWIFYSNKDTGQQYRCLEEAFVNRFREIVNEG